MKSYRTSAGFTLIEVMIVVVIIAIIAGIAIPSYFDSVRRSSRSDATIGLSTAAQGLQSCYTRYHAYNHANCGVHDELTGGNKIISRQGLYEITLSSVTATSYTLSAQPVAGTSQASDYDCRSFTLTNTGEQAATGSLGNDCW